MYSIGAMVKGTELRTVMSKFPTGVTLLTTRTDGGVIHAMTANSLLSVSLDPPLVLVSIAHSRKTYRYVTSSAKYGINMLSHEQEKAARYYAAEEENRVGESPVEFTLSGDGVPVVGSCISFLGCKVVDSHDYGDHTLFVGEVLETYMDCGEPLVFCDRQFTRVLDTRDSNEFPPPIKG